MNNILNKIDALNCLLILDKNSRDKIYKSSRNIPNIKVTDVSHFSTFDLIKFNKLILTVSSVKEIEDKYS